MIDVNAWSGGQPDLLIAGKALPITLLYHIVLLSHDVNSRTLTMELLCWLIVSSNLCYLTAIDGMDVASSFAKIQNKALGTWNCDHNNGLQLKVKNNHGNS